MRRIGATSSIIIIIEECQVYQLAEHFRERANTYNEGIWVQDSAVLQKTLEILSLSPLRQAMILDIGAGTGVVLQSLLNTYSSVETCVALDFSLSMLRQIQNPRVLRVGGDAQTLPFRSESFDVVICRQVLHYIPSLESVLSEVHRVQAKHGAMVIAQITPFGRLDEDYWIEIVKERQPLRKHFLSRDNLIVLLEQQGFAIAGVWQISARESLNSWLGRYKASDYQLERVQRLHYEAPVAYKTIHRFVEKDDDITFDNCWTFVRAVRQEIAS